MEKTNLSTLQEKMSEIALLRRADILFYWDMRTKTPDQGFDGQAAAANYFSTELFKKSTADELFELLKKLSEPEEYEKLDDKWKFIVKDMYSEMEKNRRIPEDFYARFVKEQTSSANAWEKAKQKKDYSIFAPHLDTMIQMTEQMTKYTDPGKNVYDAMLDQYEKGMSTEILDPLFEELKQGILPILNEIEKKNKKRNLKFRKTFPKAEQEKLQEFLLTYIGFQMEKGAVGESEHPFTLNFSSKDVRVTNHFFENDPLSAMFSAIHEGGHGIFEQNVNEEYDETPAGSCKYMGIHESQSRFFENILARDIAFWEPIYDEMKKIAPEFSDISLKELEEEINHVENSMIRVDADELTYCLHIIIRYEIEKEIFSGNVKTEDLNTLWNQKMKEYLHIVPENDAEGILQDMHWSDGSFGYFPSYLLGSIYDGMYLEKIEEIFGDVSEVLREGRIKDITNWLSENIHQYGSTREPKEVISQVCGKELSVKPLINYFKKKYQRIYDF